MWSRTASSVYFQLFASTYVLTFAMYERMAAILRDHQRRPLYQGDYSTGTGDKAFASGTDISQFCAFEDRAGCA